MRAWLLLVAALLLATLLLAVVHGDSAAAAVQSDSTGTDPDDDDDGLGDDDDGIQGNDDDDDAAELLHVDVDDNLGAAFASGGNCGVSFEQAKAGPLADFDFPAGGIEFVRFKGIAETALTGPPDGETAGSVESISAICFRDSAAGNLLTVIVHSDANIATENRYFTAGPASKYIIKFSDAIAQARFKIIGFTNTIGDNPIDLAVPVTVETALKGGNVASKLSPLMSSDIFDGANGVRSNGAVQTLTVTSVDGRVFDEVALEVPEGHGYCISAISVPCLQQHIHSANDHDAEPYLPHDDDGDDDDGANDDDDGNADNDD